MSTIPEPIIDDITFTGAKVTVPNKTEWPENINTLDLEIYQVTSSSSSQTWTKIRYMLDEEDVIVLTQVELQPNTTYKLRLVGTQVNSDESSSSSLVYLEGDEIEFTTLAGIPGVVRTLTTNLDSELPSKPGPVTFDNPKYNNVLCFHRNDFPTNYETFKLLYREYGDSTWLVAYDEFTETEAKTTGLLVENLIPDTEYEFVFEAENNIDSIQGDIGRYVTNTEEEELKPLAPQITLPSCPLGRTNIILQTPPLVGGADKCVIQHSTDEETWLTLNGEYNGNEVIYIGTTNQSSSSSINYVNLNLEVNSINYFRVLQVITVTSESYVSNIARVHTLPFSPGKPDEPEIEQDETVNYITLPELPENTDYFILERGIKNGSNVITWQKEWKILNAEETFPDTELNSNSTYVYRVIAVNRCGEMIGDNAETISNILPTAPGAVRIEAIGEDSILLLGPIDIGEESLGVIVQYKLHGQTDWDTHYNNDTERDYYISDEEILIEELNTGSYYEIRYVAVNENPLSYQEDTWNTGVNIGPSVLVLITGDSSISYLSSPTGVIFISSTENSITVNVGSFPIESENNTLQYAEDNSGLPSSWETLTSGLSNANTYTKIDLTPNTSYWFRTKSEIGNTTDGNYLYSYSTYKKFTTKLDLPENIDRFDLYTLSKNTIKVIFPEQDTTTRELLYRIGNGSWTQVKDDANQVINFSGVDEYEVTGLPADTLISFKIKLINESGEIESEIESAYTFTDIPNEPSKVTFSNLNATRFNIEIPTKPNNAIGVRVYELISGTWTLVENDISILITPLEITGKTPNTEYTYRFAAYNQTGETLGDIAAIKTKPTEVILPPLKPNPVIQVGPQKPVFGNLNFSHHEVTLKSPKWENNSSYPIEGIELWYKEGNKDWQEIQDGSNSSFIESEETIIVQLKRYENYLFRIRSYNIVDDVKQYSPYSENLSISLISSGEVDIIAPDTDEILFKRVTVEAEIKIQSSSSSSSSSSLEVIENTDLTLNLISNPFPSNSNLDYFEVLKDDEVIANNKNNEIENGWIISFDDDITDTLEITIISPESLEDGNYEIRLRNINNQTISYLYQSTHVTVSSSSSSSSIDITIPSSARTKEFSIDDIPLYKYSIETHLNKFWSVINTVDFPNGTVTIDAYYFGEDNLWAKDSETYNISNLLSTLSGYQEYKLNLNRDDVNISKLIFGADSHELVNGTNDKRWLQIGVRTEGNNLASTFNNEEAEIWWEQFTTSPVLPSCSWKKNENTLTPTKLYKEAFLSQLFSTHSIEKPSKTIWIGRKETPYQNYVGYKLNAEKGIKIRHVTDSTYFILTKNPTKFHLIDIDTYNFTEIPSGEDETLDLKDACYFEDKIYGITETNKIIVIDLTPVDESGLSELNHYIEPSNSVGENKIPTFIEAFEEKVIIIFKNEDEATGYSFSEGNLKREWQLSGNCQKTWVESNFLFCSIENSNNSYLYRSQQNGIGPLEIEPYNQEIQYFPSKITDIQRTAIFLENNTILRKNPITFEWESYLTLSTEHEYSAISLGRIGESYIRPFVSFKNINGFIETYANGEMDRVYLENEYLTKHNTNGITSMTFYEKEISPASGSLGTSDYVPPVYDDKILILTHGAIGSNKGYLVIYEKAKLSEESGAVLISKVNNISIVPVELTKDTNYVSPTIQQGNVIHNDNLTETENWIMTPDGNELVSENGLLTKEEN